MNALIMVTRSKCVGLATNGFASTSVNKDRILIQPPSNNLIQGLELDCSHWNEISSGLFFGSLKDGTIVQLYLTDTTNIGFLFLFFLIKLDFKINNSKFIELLFFLNYYHCKEKTKFSLKVIAKSTKPSSICSNRTGSLLFIGSSESDSILLGIKDSSKLGAGVAYTETELLSPSVKRRKGNNSDQLESAILLEEQLLYGEKLKNTNSSDKFLEPRVEIVFLSSLSSFGPVFNGMFCGSEDAIGFSSELTWEKADSNGNNNGLSPPLYSPAPAASAYIAAREAKDSLHVCSGVGMNSSLKRISSGLNTLKVANREFQGGVSIKSVQYPESSGKISSFIFISSEKTRALKYELFEGEKFHITEVNYYHL